MFVCRSMHYVALCLYVGVCTLLLNVCMSEYALCCSLLVCRSIHCVALCYYVGVCTMLLNVCMSEYDCVALYVGVCTVLLYVCMYAYALCCILCCLAGCTHCRHILARHNFYHVSI